MLSMKSYVYFIGSTESCIVKIGKANNPKARLKELQTGNPEKLLLLLTVCCSSEQEAFALETILHSKYSNLKLHGEWFTFKDSMLNTKELLELRLKILHNNKELLKMFLEVHITEGIYTTESTVPTTYILREKEIREMYKLKVLKGRVAQVGKRVFGEVFKEQTTKVIRLSAFEDYILKSANSTIIGKNNTDYLTPTFIRANLSLICKELLPLESFKLNKTGHPISCITYITSKTFIDSFDKEVLKFCDDNFTIPMHLLTPIQKKLIVDSKQTVDKEVLQLNNSYTEAEVKEVKRQLKVPTPSRAFTDNLYKSSKLFTRARALTVVKILIDDGTLTVTQEGRKKLISIKE